MGTTGDQDVIQAFFSDGANPAFAEGIGIRRLKRGMDNVDTFRLKDGIKALLNLVSLSWIKKHKDLSLPGNSQTNCLACWDTQNPLRLDVIPAMWT